LRGPGFAVLLAGATAAWGSPVGVAAQTGADSIVRYAVVGDSIPVPLTERAGDADRGQRIVTDRQLGLCLLCHSGPFAEARSQGNLATDLGGAGSRWSEGQLRLRLVDPQRIDPRSIMPAYHRVEGLTRVGYAWQGKPVLTAQQVEDVVVFLRTLRVAP
jgi:L-cysteine S-thiosulfotransferase